VNITAKKKLQTKTGNYFFAAPCIYALALGLICDWWFCYSCCFYYSYLCVYSSVQLLAANVFNKFSVQFIMWRHIG